MGVEPSDCPTPRLTPGQHDHDAGLRIEAWSSQIPPYQQALRHPAHPRCLAQQPLPRQSAIVDLGMLHETGNGFLLVDSTPVFVWTARAVLFQRTMISMSDC